MYRDEADIELLAELAGVLDQTVTAAGMSPGQYLVLRRLVTEEGPRAVMVVAAELGADPSEVADVTGRLVRVGWAEVVGTGVKATASGRTAVEGIEERANVAMREYVLERPHTATVYGLVASMQAGRFTVEDLIEFLSEGPTGDDDEKEAG